MAQLVIASITRIKNDDANFDVRQGFGGNEQHTVRPNDVIFDSAELVPAPATEGSHPTAFRFIANHIPLSVTGTYGFPVGPGTYRLRGNGPGNFQIFSESFNVTGNPGGAAVGFTATLFSNQNLNPGSPFKVAGDWTWTLLPVGNINGVANSGATRLELYFLFGSHALPYVWTDHFLELIRLSFPDYVTVAGVTWDNLEDRIISDIATRLWKLGGPGLRYDSRSDVGGTAQCLLGSNFDLGNMILQTVNFCNCYDLASLVKLALNSLGNKPDPNNANGEIPVVAGVALSADRPWGYIPTGPLFGWENSRAHHCNNPFWKGRYLNGGMDAAPNVPQYDADRTCFGAHCYTVFNRGNERRVIDICHGTITAGDIFIITKGGYNVPTYQAASIEPGAIAFGAPQAQPVNITWVNL